MYSFEEIRNVHLELSDKCNAACPQCLRSDCGGVVNPRLALTALTLEAVRTIFSPEFVRQLKSIYACGNFGDPILAPDCPRIYRYFRECNATINLGMNTNGGGRSAAFWTELGHLIPKGKGYVRFGIDGLEDTNHIYRRNVNWSILMRNARAFIEAGGNAEWDFIVFRHNEHQVDEARRFAKQLGFTHFVTKKTSRFINNQTLDLIESTPVKNRENQVVGRIEPPRQLQWQNEAVVRLRAIRERYGTVDRYLDVAPVLCKVRAERSIYVSAEGYVFPCCWLAGLLYQDPRRPEVTQLLAMLERNGGLEELDALKRSVKSIVENRFFRTAVPESWCMPSVDEGKLRTCAKICGGEMKQFDLQWEKSALTR